MQTRLYLFLLLNLLIALSLSLPRKVKRAKRYVHYSYGGEYGSSDHHNDLTDEFPDITGDVYTADDQTKGHRVVRRKGEAVVVVVVEDVTQNPNDPTLTSLLYDEETPWSRCTRSCATKRSRNCLNKRLCGTNPLEEEALCYVPGSMCENKVNSYLENEGYIIVDHSEVEAENSDDLDKDPDYIPEYEVIEKYDESVLYPKAADYDYDLGDRTAGKPGDDDEEESPASKGKAEEVYDRTYDHQDHTVEEDAEEVREKDGVFLFEGCGKRPVRNTGGLLRILGGRTAHEGSWPWQVAVLHWNKEHTCGGTLIAAQWVLTAAHCVETGTYYVRMGEHDLRLKGKDEVEMKVEKIISHTQYDNVTFENDIALLKLPRKVGYNRYIVPVCLPDVSALPPKGIECVVSGWGYERAADHSGNEVLKYARVPVVSRFDCVDAYPNHPISRNQFCAGLRKGGADTCTGDSGGPLVCNDLGTWSVHGVTSFGDGCGKPGKFGVYTKVQSYLQWINIILKGT